MIGTAILIARRSLGLTAVEVAARAGIGTAHLSMIEHGKRGPSWESLTAIGRACYAPASQLCRIAECLEARELLPFTASEFHGVILLYLNPPKPGRRRRKQSAKALAAAETAVRAFTPPDEILRAHDFDPAKPKAAKSIP